MSNDRFLLIKPWSYILWADLEHVLTQLLVAEITGRTPVVFWPTHCLFNGFVQTNAFELYFKPVSNNNIFNLAKDEYSFYPPVWNADNLLVTDHNKDMWLYRNIGDIISSKANVVVSDNRYSMFELIPFIKKNHPAYGMNVQQIQRYIFNKYIKLKPDIQKEIDDFYYKHMHDAQPRLAVHVKKEESNIIFDTKNSYLYGNDNWNQINKKYEKYLTKNKGLKLCRKCKSYEPNKIYHPEIKKIVDKYDVKKIFLFTDCEEIVREYQDMYGSKLVYTDCQRLTDDTEYMMENHMIKRRIGMESLMDVYLAARCEFFIGNDFSHMSHAVSYLKDWGDKSVKYLYWVYKGRKFPVNAKFITKENKEGFFNRLMQKFLGKSRGDKNAK